jgi:hypothetical protein
MTPPGLENAKVYPNSFVYCKLKTTRLMTKVKNPELKNYTQVNLVAIDKS